MITHSQRANGAQRRNDAKNKKIERAHGIDGGREGERCEGWSAAMKNNNRRLGKSVGAPPAAEERLRSGCLSPTSYRRSPKSTHSLLPCRSIRSATRLDDLVPIQWSIAHGSSRGCSSLGSSSCSRLRREEGNSLRCVYLAQRGWRQASKTSGYGRAV